MSRPKRLVVPERPHHIVQRGNRRTDVFREDNDRLVFLRMFGAASEKHGLATIAYSLMINHVHFVSTPEREDSLPLALREVFGSYALYFNGKYGLSGHVWQGRFYSAVLDDSHCWAAIRYAELNVVRAGILKYAELFQWSSARAHCGLIEDSLLSPLPAGDYYVPNWSDWLREGDAPAQLEFIRKCTQTGRPCGTEAYVRELERITGRVLFPQKGGRPRKKY